MISKKNRLHFLCAKHVFSFSYGKKHDPEMFFTSFIFGYDDERMMMMTVVMMKVMMMFDSPLSVPAAQ